MFVVYGKCVGDLEYGIYVEDFCEVGVNVSEYLVGEEDIVLDFFG